MAPPLFAWGMTMSSLFNNSSGAFLSDSKILEERVSSLDWAHKSIRYGRVLGPWVRNNFHEEVFILHLKKKVEMSRLKSKYNFVNKVEMLIMELTLQD